MENKRFDFVIEGASIAGHTIALSLAEDGHKIALCDPSFGNPPRYESTREKPCGGVVNSEIIENYNVPETFKSEKAKKEIRIIDARIKRYVFISPDGERTLEYKPSNNDAVVRRKNLDWFNLEPCLFMDKNITFFPHRIVSVRKKKGTSEKNGSFENILDNGKKIEGTYEVGAGGIWSVIRSNLFWHLEPDRFSNTATQFLYYPSEEEVKRRFDDTAYFYFQKELGIGYAFIFPGYDYVRVGVGERNNPSIVNRFGKLKECHARIFSNPVLKEKLEGFKDKSEIKNHAVPYGGSKNFYEKHSTCDKRKVLLGDAAIKTHSMTFEGIYFATLDAEVAHECFSANQSFAKFDEMWKARYGDKLICDRDTIANFYDKAKLTELFDYCRRFNEPEKFVAAFKGLVYISRPDLLKKARLQVKKLESS